MLVYCLDRFWIIWISISRIDLGIFIGIDCLIWCGLFSARDCSFGDCGSFHHLGHLWAVRQASILKRTRWILICHSLGGTFVGQIIICMWCQHITGHLQHAKITVILFSNTKDGFLVIHPLEWVWNETSIHFTLRSLTSVPDEQDSFHSALDWSKKKDEVIIKESGMMWKCYQRWVEEITASEGNG